MLEATDFLAFVWITPKEVDDLLVILDMVRPQLDFKGSLDLFDALNIGDLGTNTTMTTENTLLLISDNNRERKVIESIVYFCKATVRVVDVFA